MSKQTSYVRAVSCFAATALLVAAASCSSDYHWSSDEVSGSAGMRSASGGVAASSGAGSEASGNTAASAGSTGGAGGDLDASGGAGGDSADGGGRAENTSGAAAGGKSGGAGSSGGARASGGATIADGGATVADGGAAGSDAVAGDGSSGAAGGSAACAGASIGEFALVSSWLQNKDAKGALPAAAYSNIAANFPLGSAFDQLACAIATSCVQFAPMERRWLRRCEAVLTSAIVAESRYDPKSVATDAYATRTVSGVIANDPTVGLLQVRFSGWGSVTEHDGSEISERGMTLWG